MFDFLFRSLIRARTFLTAPQRERGAEMVEYAVLCVVLK